MDKEVLRKAAERELVKRTESLSLCRSEKMVLKVPYSAQQWLVIVSFLISSL